MAMKKNQKEELEKMVWDRLKTDLVNKAAGDLIHEIFNRDDQPEYHELKDLINEHLEQTKIVMRKFIKKTFSK